MINKLLNIMRRETAAILARSSKVSMGTISSYRPDIHAAKVKLQPEGVLTGWLPLASVAAGAGGGLAAGPNVGDQVLVHFPDGDRNAGVILGRLFSDQDAAPNVPAGEIWVQHASGSVLKFLTSGEIDIVAQSGSVIKFLTSGDVVVIPAGNLHLGGTGGLAVARVTDPVAGGVITAGSSKVFAA
ncbi:MAG: phage baseplate assembly protein V [Devosia sp.]|nr:phage baseplate assembly protein V [Devosia sp.]